MVVDPLAPLEYVIVTVPVAPIQEFVFLLIINVPLPPKVPVGDAPFNVTLPPTVFNDQIGGVAD